MLARAGASLWICMFFRGGLSFSVRAPASVFSLRDACGGMFHDGCGWWTPIAQAGLGLRRWEIAETVTLELTVTLE